MENTEQNSAVRVATVQEASSGEPEDYFKWYRGSLDTQIGFTCQICFEMQKGQILGLAICNQCREDLRELVLQRRKAAYKTRDIDRVVKENNSKEPTIY